MSAPLFKLELFGGPADGFKVATPQLPARMVRMPASPSAATCEDGPSHRPSDKFLALYDLASRRYDFDRDALPVVRLRYEFVGMRPCDERVSTWRTRWVQRTGLAWLRGLLAATVRKRHQTEEDRRSPTLPG